MINKIINYFKYYIRYIITICMITVLLIVAYFSYLKLYLNPIEENALNQFFDAKKYFQEKKFQQALGNNKKDNSGFLGILNKYPLTRVANISNYYAGLCYYNLSNYNHAIKTWNKFITNDDITPSLKYGMIGDAFEKLNNNHEALKYYKKAAKNASFFSIPVYYYKIGLIYYFMNENKKALYYFLFLKNKYGESCLSKNLNLYIGLIKYKLYNQKSLSD